MRRRDANDGLVRLYAQLEPLSRGLAQQARSDPKGFIIRLPRIISGTVVQGLLTLIHEVGARDDDHEMRLLQLEQHPLLNIAPVEGLEFDPNDPQVMFAFLQDIKAYLLMLDGFAGQVPAIANNPVIQRITQNRLMVEAMIVGVQYALDALASTADGEGADNDDEPSEANEVEAPEEARLEGAPEETSQAPAGDDDLPPTVQLTTTGEANDENDAAPVE